MSARAKQAQAAAELPKPRLPKGVEIYRFTDETEVAQIFLSGLIAQGKVSPDKVVRIYVDNLTAFAFEKHPPAVVVELLGVRPPGGQQA